MLRFSEDWTLCIFPATWGASFYFPVEPWYPQDLQYVNSCFCDLLQHQPPVLLRWPPLFAYWRNGQIHTVQNTYLRSPLQQKVSCHCLDFFSAQSSGLQYFIEVLYLFIYSPSFSIMELKVVHTRVLKCLPDLSNFTNAAASLSSLPYCGDLGSVDTVPVGAWPGTSAISLASHDPRVHPGFSSVTAHHKGLDLEQITAMQVMHCNLPIPHSLAIKLARHLRARFEIPYLGGWVGG